MRKGPGKAFDPFKWVGQDIYLPVFFNHSHFEFIRPLGGVLITGAIFLLLASYWFYSDANKLKYRSLVPPAALIAGALSVTILLSLISFYRDYWILQRQWVASMALVTIGVIWLAAEVSQVLSRVRPKIGRGIYPVVLFYVLIMLYPSLQENYHRLNDYISESSEYADGVPVPPGPNDLPKSNGDWVALAASNIEAGGKVWPVFRIYYGLEQ
jgi:hypothetical protein